VAEHSAVSDLYVHPQHGRWAFDVTGGPAVVAAVRRVEGTLFYQGQTFFIKNSCAPTRVYSDVLRAVDAIGA
jgi:hypothetical protein